jgi:hypothetical protein
VVVERPEAAQDERIMAPKSREGEGGFDITKNEFSGEGAKRNGRSGLGGSDIKTESRGGFPEEAMSEEGRKWCQAEK